MSTIGINVDLPSHLFDARCHVRGIPLRRGDPFWVVRDGDVEGRVCDLLVADQVGGRVEHLVISRGEVFRPWQIHADYKSALRLSLAELQQQVAQKVGEIAHLNRQLTVLEQLAVKEGVLA